ncbi:hydrogenase maturation protease [Lentzea sp. BCCO 10_0856]|uniref:Hydrogenase maturation protease n=1 Tax=Lentzea miocenica TaxID=3095431 RepID=A0ABU4TAG7_9PSEU|nr:hydrogenase maturation protease [Lentzea sp. BCCO 10_0856]MDX8034932.1 hydrogenase maturation protease [Lentzea sp. BCCO 10_0856]
MTERMLVAGVGNVFLGDDGFGVEVVRRLAGVPLPEWVRIADYGVRGLHLAYDLAGLDHELTILVDATVRGDEAGTVHVVELDTSITATPCLDAHGMQPDVVLNLLAWLGCPPRRMVLVGCEPAVLDHRMGLSPAVERAVGTAAGAVVDIVTNHGR